MVFQYPVVYRGISVYRNIELPLQSMKLSKAERRLRVESALTLMGLESAANLDVSKLDNGTRQKVAVAREVARQPQIILFDEPITNVDAASKLQLKRSLQRADAEPAADHHLRHARSDGGDDPGRPNRPHAGRQDRPVRRPA